MSRAQNHRRVLILAAASAALPALNTAAVTRDWLTGGGGVFGSGANWSGGNVPGPVDMAHFNLGGSYTVTFNASTANAALLFGTSSGSVTMIGAGNPNYVVSGTALVSAGTFALGTSLLNQMTLSIGSTLSIRGGGTMNVSGQSDLSAASLSLGAAGDGTLNVSGLGTTLFSSGSAFLGQNGAVGTVNISSGASADFNANLTLASSATAGSAGFFTVSNSIDPTVVTARTVSIAQSAITSHRGVLTVGGGVGTSSFTQDAGSVLILGAASGNRGGTVAVNAGGTYVTGAGTSAVTVFATGNINIAGGTFVLNGDALLNGGRLTRASGGLTIAAGKTLTASSGATLDLGANFSLNSGTIIATAASTFNAPGTLRIVPSGGTARMRIEEGASATFGSLEIASAGTNPANAEIRIRVPAFLGGINIATNGSAVQLGELEFTDNVTVSGAINLGAATLPAFADARINIFDGTFNSGTSGVNILNGGNIGIVGDTVFNVNSNLLLDGGNLEIVDSQVALNFAPGTLLTARNGAQVLLNTFVTLSGTRSALISGTGTLFSAGLTLNNDGGPSALVASNGATLALSAPTIELLAGQTHTASISITSGAFGTAFGEISLAAAAGSGSASLLINGPGSYLVQSTFGSTTIGNSVSGSATVHEYRSKTIEYTALAPARLRTAA